MCSSWSIPKPFSTKRNLLPNLQFGLQHSSFHTSLSLLIAPISARYSPPRGRMSLGQREETIHNYEKQPEQVAACQDPVSYFVTGMCSGLCQNMLHLCASASQLQSGYKMLPFVLCLSFWNQGVYGLSFTTCTCRALCPLCATAAQLRKMAILLV